MDQDKEEKTKTYYQKTQELILEGINDAQEEITNLNNYVTKMQGILTQLEHIEKSTCPFCGGEMIDLGSLNPGEIYIYNNWGPRRLDEYWDHDYRPSPDGEECQDCGIYVCNPGDNIQYNWDRESKPKGRDALASLILDNYPQVERVILSRVCYSGQFFFKVEDKWYTFGTPAKRVIIDQMNLDQALPTQKDRAGYIYVIRAEIGCYKIGRSKNISQRTAFFGLTLPFSIEIIHTFPADDMYSAEKELHDYFSHKRVNGEWFTLTDEEISRFLTITLYKDGKFLK